MFGLQKLQLRHIKPRQRGTIRTWLDQESKNPPSSSTSAPETSYRFREVEIGDSLAFQHQHQSELDDSFFKKGVDSSTGKSHHPAGLDPQYLKNHEIAELALIEARG